jgi:hypothetical protein
MGHTQDEHGQFLIDGKPIDVTTRGVTAIEDVLSRAWDKIESSAIDEVRKYFLANPEEIPEIDALQFGFSSTVAGGPPKEPAG